MIRALVASDFHPDWPLLGRSRIEEVGIAMHESVDAAIESNCSHYWFMGDLCDPDNGGDTFKSIELMLEISFRLRSKSIDMIVLAGNHDVETDGSSTTTLTPLRALEKLYPRRFILAEAPRTVVLDDHTMALCLPYTAPSAAYEPATTATELMRTARGRRVIVLAHLMLPGIHPGSETKDMPRGREVTFPFKETSPAFMRFNGHYHARQTFDPKDGGEPIQIPGSVARLTFGEEPNQPGFLIVDIPDVE